MKVYSGRFRGGEDEEGTLGDDAPDTGVRLAVTTYRQMLDITDGVITAKKQWT